MFRNFQDPQYKKWRKLVYSRDEFVCQWPGCSIKKNLNAHHIKKWSDYPGLRFNIDNGITLCKIHHNMIKNMEENYEQFFFKIICSKK